MNLIKNTGLKTAVNGIIKMTVGKGGKKVYFVRKKTGKRYNPTAVRRMNGGLISPETNHRVPTAIRAKVSHLRKLRRMK